MTATKLELARTQLKPLIQRTVDRSSNSDAQSLQRQRDDCEAQAKEAAQRGDVSAAAKLILAALDLERRLASRGPQVLQLIKPRG